MRKIAFRAWDIFYKKFIYSDECANLAEFWAKVQGGLDAGREVPVEGWTGLTDKNGKEIYEGDILEEDSEWWQVQYTDRAMYEAISFPRSVDFALEEIVGSATVQGNIYENPELLETK